MAVDPLTLIAGGASILGGLFGNKSSYKDQAKLMQDQWAREDSKKPYQSTVYSNPAMRARLDASMGNNMIDWASLAPMLRGSTATYLNGLVPKFNTNYAAPKQQSNVVVDPNRIINRGFNQDDQQMYGRSY